MQGYSNDSHDSKSQESLLLAADFFLFLSDSTVLMILSAIRRKEMTYLELAGELGIPPLVVFTKLRAMEREGLLVSHFRPRGLFFRVVDNEVAQALEQILAIPKKQLQRVYDRKAVAAGTNENRRESPFRDTAK